MWKKALIFAGGVVVGGAATYLFMRHKMERIIEEEVEDVKKVYARDETGETGILGLISKNDTDEGSREDNPHALDPAEAKRISMENMKRKDDLLHVEKLIVNNGYSSPTNYNIFSKPLPEEEIRDLGTGADDEMEEDEDDEGYPKESVADRPYTISGEEFVNGNKFYDKTTLNYYDDGILEDEITEEIIEDIDAAIGMDSLTKFGEYEEDVVFVRNERLSTDYEVVRQYRDFAQIPKEDSD